MGHFLVHFLGYSLGSLWTPSQTEGQQPLWLSGLPGTDNITNRACLRTFEYSLVEGYDKLGRPNSAQSKFPLEISLRGGCVLCDEDPRPPSKPAPQGFLQSKNALRRTNATKFAAQQKDR